ncbi:hypothetical protein HYW39_01690 [Candidatus Curtissbacteria bacterium]|nr:hypothetical protein [Candidatus Curtissbacteria bacterium]
MSDKDLKQLLKYSDKYVAYVGKFLNIIASGDTMADVEKKLTKKKIKDATITYIPPSSRSFSPVCR